MTPKLCKKSCGSCKTHFLSLQNISPLKYGVDNSHSFDIILWINYDRLTKPWLYVHMLGSIKTFKCTFEMYIHVNYLNWFGASKMHLSPSVA